MPIWFFIEKQFVVNKSFREVFAFDTLIVLFCYRKKKRFKYSQVACLNVDTQTFKH
jgi:hypothetical protein